jgi:hypothetical protein
LRHPGQGKTFKALIHDKLHFNELNVRTKSHTVDDSLDFGQMV